MTARPREQPHAGQPMTRAEMEQAVYHALLTGDGSLRDTAAAVVGVVEQQILPAHEATIRRELHLPTIAPMHSGEWGVQCFACSQAAQDYVPRCLHDRDDWPPLVLTEAPPSTLMDALADKHTRGDT